MLMAGHSWKGGVETMKCISIGLGLLWLGLAGVGLAQGSAKSNATEEHYSSAQLKKLVAEAHTPEQFNVLAHYYDGQKQMLLEKAADEKQEWVRRSQYTTSISAKYPSPVDSARNLYEYYSQKASNAGALAEKYRQLARPAVRPAAQ
jgi:hypothetical protein